MLHSGKHGRAFYAQMWSSIHRNGVWEGEIWNPKLDEERLKQLAQYDPLTGLPNRRLLNERLQRVVSRHLPDRGLAVLFLDLDHFKDINDRWGHAAGDLLLQAVAARLHGCVRRTDTVARWAGDEFAVLLNPISGRGDAQRVADKILRVLRRPFTLNGRRARTTASIGSCLLVGKSTPNQLLRRADQAMYEIKEHGRNGVRFWTRAVSLRRTSAPGTNGASPSPGKTVPLKERAPQKQHSRTG